MGQTTEGQIGDNLDRVEAAETVGTIFTSVVMVVTGFVRTGVGHIRQRLADNRLAFDLFETAKAALTAFKRVLVMMGAPVMVGGDYQIAGRHDQHAKNHYSNQNGLKPIAATVWIQRVMHCFLNLRRRRLFQRHRQTIY
jgi:hypothetical protein